jgi:hypothetical protein
MRALGRPDLAAEKTAPCVAVLHSHQYRRWNLLESKFMAKSYKDLVAQAEKAVSSVSDLSLSHRGTAASRRSTVMAERNP